jgi:hypothetical protein
LNNVDLPTFGRPTIAMTGVWEGNVNEQAGRVGKKLPSGAQFCGFAAPPGV